MSTKRTSNGQFSQGAPLDTAPKHVAIICDGNRRWARERHLPSFLGHKRAVDAVFEPLITRAKEHGVSYLTFWIFSTENWKRDAEEVEGLLTLFRSFFDAQVQQLKTQGVRFRVIGNVQQFPKDIQERILRGEAETAENTQITVVLAMNYGGRDELTRAVRAVAQAVASGVLRPEDVSQESVAQHLDTAGIPDPDLIIRTSGEQRMSGFLPWQSVYSEYWFPEFHFPEFTPEHFDEAIREYAARERRFGGNSAR